MPTTGVRSPWAFGVKTLVLAMRGEAEEALRMADQALAVAAGDPLLVDLRLLLRTNQAAILGELDQYERAIDAAERACRLADDSGNVIRLAQAQSVLAELFFEVGRWDDAVAEVDPVFTSTKNVVGRVQQPRNRRARPLPPGGAGG
jgi:tetratricopeptide (TPR) repeat protein